MARPRRVLSAFAIAAVVAAGAPLATTGPAGAADDVGFRDFAYSESAPGRTATAPTGQKPQSKLWFADGRWWGVLFNASVGDFQIYRYDWPTHTWSTTGVLVDERSSSFVDAMWDESTGKLYVAAAGMKSTDPALDGTRSPKVMRFSYNAATDAYSLDAGFPVTIGSGGVEAVVMDKDSTGLLWATFTQGSQVRLTHSTPGNDALWVTPYKLPHDKASVSDDDISAVVAYDGNKVGVMWSNDLDQTMYFATHLDGAPDNQWTVTAAYAEPEGADDHINLKSLQADPAGRVFAALKTSLNAPGDPLVHLLVLQPGSSSWESHPFGAVADDHTRPIVLIDTENREVYMFAATPCCAGGTIVYKKSSLDDISFPPGVGTTFMKSSLDPEINNPTSTKQNLNSATDLVVMAGDDSTRRYLHNRIELAAEPAPGPAPDTTITAGPAGTVNSTSASFSFTSNSSTATFECSLDGAAFAACSSPKAYSALSEGAHTFAVRAVDTNGADASPATRSWTVDVTAPTVTITGGPSGTTTSTSASFTFTSADATASFQCSLDGGSFSGCSSPKSYVGLAVGPHTFAVRARDGAGNVGTAATRSWTVAQETEPQEPPASGFTDGFESGNFGKWADVSSGGGGTAAVQSTVVRSGSFAARLEATGAGSFAVARARLADALDEARVSEDVRVLREGSTSSPLTKAAGYWMVASDGGIFAFGQAPFLGSTGDIALAQPVVGMETTPSGNGYWMVATDGGIFAFGDAGFFGSTGDIALAQPIVGMASTPSGNGYWLVASDGGIFAFGDAGFFGSTGDIALAQPIVGMETTSSGKGYWLVASDGGIFAFGDAKFFGSTGDIALAQPIVGMETTPSGKGYWLVASDGGIFAFGDATFFGSTGDIALAQPIVGMETTPSGKGYWLVASDGGVFAFGDAVFLGSTGDIALAKPIGGMTARLLTAAPPAAKAVPLVTVTDQDGGTLVAVERRSGDGRLRVHHGGSSVLLSAKLPLATWADLDLAVDTSGPGGGSVQVRLNGTLVHESSAAGLAGDVGGVAIGSPEAGRDYAVAVDNVSVQP